jgi:hypothetical protein
VEPGRIDDLFDHFPIDADELFALMSSRLIQASVPVQLFVQRVLMNLEPGLMLSDEAVEQWMKNYRALEANRKIFLTQKKLIELRVARRQDAILQGV